MDKQFSRWMPEGPHGSPAEALAALVKQLPLKVRTPMRTEVLERAMQARLIRIADDGRHLLWLGESNTLLAYFCGRLWCGDRGRYSRRKGGQVWLMGRGTFPGAELNRLFGLTTLKQTRARRKNMRLPECWQLVDRLFDGEDHDPLTVNRR